MKTKTQKEIDAEIKWLTENRNKVPPMTVFHESNTAAIDAQIEALKKDMTEDEAYDKEASGDWSERERENAIEAINWRDGDTENAPSSQDGWGGMIKE